MTRDGSQWIGKLCDWARDKRRRLPLYYDDGQLYRMFVNGVTPAYDYTFEYDDMRRLKIHIPLSKPELRCSSIPTIWLLMKPSVTIGLTA